MVRTYQEVPKRAKNSINCQIEKLIQKYGFKEVNLVVNKIFQKRKNKQKLQEEIEQRERELAKLKKGI
jgi:CO dehydrogenase nickel-insertion accessory protein CooC1